MTDQPKTAMDFATAYGQNKQPGGGGTSARKDLFEQLHGRTWGSDGPDALIDAFQAEVIEDVLPVWEAMYEPGNVSDYLIGYANSEVAAKGAALAWLQSEGEFNTFRLEWVEQRPGDRHDQWFDLIENHDDGIPTDTGINVRRRLPVASNPQEDRSSRD